MKVLLPDGAPPSVDPIRDILTKYKTIAVVGLSSNPVRPSYASLEEVPQRIEIVDIFRRPEEVPPVVDAAIRAGAKVIWMQQGIANEAAAEKARAAGLTVVMDACILVEHKKRRQHL